MASDIAERARQMLDLWRQLAMRHVALGATCACGTGGVSLRLEDFELDIADYLEDAGRRCGIAEVEAYFKTQTSIVTFEQPLRELLGHALEGRLPDAVGDWLMPKVEKTLRSFAELHGPGARG